MANAYGKAGQDTTTNLAVRNMGTITRKISAEGVKVNLL